METQLISSQNDLLDQLKVGQRARAGIIGRIRWLLGKYSKWVSLRTLLSTFFPMSRLRKSFTDWPCLISVFMEWLEGCETWFFFFFFDPPHPFKSAVSIATAPTQEALKNQWRGKWFPGSDKKIKHKNKTKQKTAWPSLLKRLKDHY